mmetsp:Transcript_726/g.1496  ORF Transcript_726/g.1496 Transcript_726/m.1496 type:complete len:338 (+) Transcript_726:79-1092(+)
MAQLLEVLALGGTDRQTAAFLVEALGNAEAADWDSILEPFVQPRPVIDLLVSNLEELQRASLIIRAEGEGAVNKVHAQSCQDPLDLVEQLDDSGIQEGLLGAGFKALGDGIWYSQASHITVELAPGALPIVSVDGCPGDEILSFVAKAVSEVGSTELGRALVENKWSRGRDCMPELDAEDDSEAESDSERDPEGFDIRCLPRAIDVGARRDRQITLITWGFFKLARPPEAQALINCSCKKFHYLTRNNKHIKKLNGLDDVVQGRICRNTFFASWLLEAIGRIEREDLNMVSMCCAKGTHLSVAIAEMMRKAYYPKATVQHLTLTHNRPGHAGGSRRH